MNTSPHLIWAILRVLIASFVIYAGVQHFIKPDFFVKVIPPFLMGLKMPIIYLSGVFEIVLGAMMLINRFQRIGTFGVFLLMLFFLPLHIWDLVDPSHPITESLKLSSIRLVLQFVLLGILWKLTKVYGRAE